MSLSLRFILPLLIALSVITYGTMTLTDRLVMNWFIRDVEIRSKLITHTLSDAIDAALKEKKQAELQRRIAYIFRNATIDDRLYAIAFCDRSGKMISASELFPQSLTCVGALNLPTLRSSVVQIGKAPVHVTYASVDSEIGNIGSLILVHDLSFISRRTTETKQYLFYFFAILSVITSLVTVVVAQLSWRGWVNGMRSVLSGEGIFRRPFSPTLSPELKPLVKDLRALVREIESDKAIRDEGSISWSAETLREILRKDLAGEEVLTVSNREPYIHVKRGDKIETQFPASGLVSALEPVMRACSGTWIAHGSGNADKEAVDAHDRVRVPPNNPSYQIRRVWLTPEEEKGYYYGFSNEGLWPLCHVAHTRPIFRTSDWEAYIAVNKKFAQAVIEESRTEDPVVLVQDYHFALLPRMIKERLPRATVITFWHIPWPNPEVFGICPWREEILQGMLGSSILGFHTRFHCNNFIDTVDRFLEARIDRETNTIASGGQLTAVRNYPISIEWPSQWSENQEAISTCRRLVREKIGIAADIKIGIGVDRLDYTKGILERFMAVERLLELSPSWRGRFSFVQIASPSRGIIEHYKHFDEAVRAEATRINQRFGKDNYQPIHLLVEHHTPFDVFQHFRAADLCFVSSLHDGMNLVAKEFVAARDDEQGVLILSQFTGASRELPEALIVNPYNIDECAAALHVALEMSARDQRERMRSMRNFIREFNVFRWAGRMLIDAARMRQRNRFQARFRPKDFFGA
ncbi:MAG: trehalose-6-phosphate synthase [Bacteriovoracia bacterium]